MAIYNIFVFSAQNLLNGDGEQSYQSNDTNAPNSNAVSGTFTHGATPGFNIQIEDLGTGANNNTGSGVIFEDDPSRAQELTEGATFTYELPNGNTATTFFPAGSQIQAELQQTFANGSTIVVLRIENPAGNGFLTVGYTFVGPIPPAGTDLGAYTGGENSGDVPYAEIICFTAGIAIPTPEGSRRIEDIQVGDLIVTRDSGVQRVTWVGQTQITELDFMRYPNLRPVMVPAGVMGAARDLMFSRQHRALLKGPNVELVTGHNEVLAAVGHLQELVHDAPAPQSVVYYHLACDAHEIINAEGLWVETLLTIPDHVDAIKAELVDANDRIAARPILKKWEVAAVLAQGRFVAA